MSEHVMGRRLSAGASVGGRRRLAVSVALALLGLWLLVQAVRGESALVIGSEPLPGGVVVEQVAVVEGFPIAMAFAPDGRLFYTTKGGFGGDGFGQVWVLARGATQPSLFLSTPVNTTVDRGLLGIALDPDFATNRQLYLFKTATLTETGTGQLANRVLRVTEDPSTGRAIPGSEQIVMEVPVHPTFNTFHMGGNLHFGPDAKLYVTIGDYAEHNDNSQNLKTFKGKIHRLNPDGGVPDDNPFADRADGTVRTIWSYGNRNSFDFTFDPRTGRLFFSENGPECDDEINLGQAGGNFGWPHDCGEVPTGTLPPLLRYAQPVGLAGIDFYTGPIAGWDGSLFWCAVNTGTLYRGWLNAGRTSLAGVNVVQGAPSCAVDVQTGPDGALYLSSNSRIWRIRPTAAFNTPTPRPTGTPSVSCFDYDSDRRVTLRDVQMVAMRWHQARLYEVRYDVVPDRLIDARDVMRVAVNWHSACR